MYAPAGSTEQNWPYGLPGTIGPYGPIGSDGAPMAYGLNALAGLNNAASPITANAGATGNVFTTLRNVKSPEQEARINTVAGDFDTARTSTSNALAEFTKKFLGNTPIAERNVAEENAVVGGYYSGEVGNTLAALRARRAAAMEEAGNRALEYEKRNRNVTQLMTGGTGSSYLDRLGLKAATDIRTREALDQAEQERRDFDYVQSGKLGLRGARTGALDALANRELVPIDAQNRAMADRINQLGALTGMVHSNSLWGVGKTYDPNYEGGFFGDLNFSTGGPMGGGRQPGYGFRFGGPSAGQPFHNTPTIRPSVNPSVMANPNFSRQFPGGGYRDQYGRWVTPDPTTGQWPTGGGVQFEPGWNSSRLPDQLPVYQGPTPYGLDLISLQQDFYENPEKYDYVQPWN